MRRWADSMTVTHQVVPANAYDPPASSTSGPYTATVTPADDRSVYYSEMRGERVTHLAVVEAGAEVRVGDRATVGGISYLVRRIRHAGRWLVMGLEVMQ